MRKTAFALVAVALAAIVWNAAPAEAGELPPYGPNGIGCSKCARLAVAGELDVTDAGSVNNASTRTPFSLGSNDLLSVQCPDAGAWISVGVLACAPGTGVLIGAGDLFETSINAATDAGVLTDGGRYFGGIVCAAATPGVAATRCYVQNRKGNE